METNKSFRQPITGLMLFGLILGLLPGFVDGAKVFNIARGGRHAFIAVSGNYGRTWSASQNSNLRMDQQKPTAGVLSTGQRYLIATVTADDNRRDPLTIAVSKPGKNAFSKVFVIRRALNPGQPGESHEDANLSYPYAMEHDGKLYVIYTSQKKHSVMTIIPVKSLGLTPTDENE